MIPEDFLFGGLMCAFTLLPMWLMFRKKDRILTFETTSKSYASMAIAATWIAILIGFSANCFYLFLYEGPTFVTGEHVFTLELLFLLLGISFAFPLVLLVTYYLAPLKTLLRRYRPLKKGLDDETRILITQLTESLSLEREPFAVLADEPSSPLVFGKTSRNGVLLLPRRWRQKANGVQKNAGRASALNGAVVAHELAHIKNGDVGLVVWGERCFRILGYWLVGVALITVSVAIIYPMTAVHEDLVYIALLSVIVVVYLWFSYNSVSRIREMQADARASLVIPSESIERSILKAEIESHFPERKRNRPERFRLLKQAKRLWMRLGMSHHPLIPQRIASLREGRYLSEENEMPTVIHAIWAGVSTSILMYLILVFFSTAFSLARLNWQQFVNQMTGNLVLGSLFVALVPFFSNYMIAPSVKSKRIRIDRGIVLDLLPKFFLASMVGAGILGGLTFLTPSGLMAGYLGHMETSYWVVRFLQVATLSGLIAAMLLVIAALSSLGERQDTATMPIHVPAVMLSLLLVIAIGLAITQAWNVDMDKALYAIFCAMAIYHGVGGVTIRGFTKFAGDFRRMILTLECGDTYRAIDFKERSLLNLVKFYTLETTLVLLLFFLPALVFIPLTILIFWPISFQDQRTLATIISISILGFGFFSAWIRERTHRISTFENLYYVLAILSRLGIVETMTETRRYELADSIMQFRVESGAFALSDSRTVGAMLETYRGYYSLAVLESMEDTGRLVDWILSCESQEGGFGHIPGGHPSLESTHYGIAMLKSLGYDTAINVDRHSEWVLRHFQKEGFFADPKDTSDLARLTYYAASALESMDSLTSQKTEIIRCWAESELNRLPSLEDVFYVVHILKLTGLTEEAKEKARKILKEEENTLEFTRVDKNAYQMFHFLEVEGLTDDLDRDTLSAERDGSVSKRLMKYIQHVELWT